MFHDSDSDGATARSDSEFVLHYPEQAYRCSGLVMQGAFAAICLALIAVGLKGWQATGCWALALYPCCVGFIGLAMSVRSITRFAVTGNRGARGDWWLRLSPLGFEVNDRVRAPRRYAWSDIDAFVLVETHERLDDNEIRIVRRVGFRCLHRHPESTRNRDHATVDGYVMAWWDRENGSWDRSLDEATDLLNGWLARSRNAGTAEIDEISSPTGTLRPKGGFGRRFRRGRGRPEAIAASCVAASPRRTARSAPPEATARPVPALRRPGPHGVALSADLHGHRGVGDDV